MTQGVALGWLVDAPLVLHRKVHDRGKKTKLRFSPAKEKAMRSRFSTHKDTSESDSNCAQSEPGGG